MLICVKDDSLSLAEVDPSELLYLWCFLFRCFTGNHFYLQNVQDLYCIFVCVYGWVCNHIAYSDGYIRQLVYSANFTRAKQRKNNKREKWGKLNCVCMCVLICVPIWPCLWVCISVCQEDTDAVSMSACANVCVLCVIRGMEEGGEGQKPRRRWYRKVEKVLQERGKDLWGDGRVMECVCGQGECIAGVCVCFWRVWVRHRQPGKESRCFWTSSSASFLILAQPLGLNEAVKLWIFHDFYCVNHKEI